MRQYFKPGLPYVDKIEFRIMKDGVTRAAALRAGEVDFVNLVPIEHVERLSKDPKMRVFRGPETATIFLVANNGRRPFDDVRVRASDDRLWHRPTGHRQIGAARVGVTPSELRAPGHIGPQRFSRTVPVQP